MKRVLVLIILFIPLLSFAQDKPGKGNYIASGFPGNKSLHYVYEKSRKVFYNWEEDTGKGYKAEKGMILKLFKNVRKIKWNELKESLPDTTPSKDGNYAKFEVFLDGKTYSFIWEQGPEKYKDLDWLEYEMTTFW